MAGAVLRAEVALEKTMKELREGDPAEHEGRHHRAAEPEERRRHAESGIGPYAGKPGVSAGVPGVSAEESGVPDVPTVGGLDELPPDASAAGTQ